MSELESSGLLERDSAQNPAHGTLSHGKNTAQADSSISTSPKPQTAPEAQPSLAAAIVDAVNDDTAAVPKQQDLSSLPDQEAASLANADASPSEAAEQRVLGDLEGAPTWREVLLPGIFLSKSQDSSRSLILLVSILCLRPVGMHSKACLHMHHITSFYTLAVTCSAAQRMQSCTGHYAARRMVMIISDPCWSKVFLIKTWW